MFTGLIEEIGTISLIKTLSGAKQITVKASRILDDLKVDDSVCVNGICLTATAIHPDGFEATAVQETLEKSTIRDWKQGQSVNLERALRLSDRLGGHLVQGHVDGVGRVQSIQKLGEGHRIRMAIPKTLSVYVIEKGSIAADGVSLTVAAVLGDLIEIAVIPHTWKQTAMQFVKTGNRMNIEVDLIGKYVRKMMGSESEEPEKTIERLKSMGY